jgi:nucleotide-binding universal stress UspA family protein
MKRSVVVGVDGTDDSRNALARAAELARVVGLRLVVVHVRHIPVFAEMSSMTIGPARQDLDEIGAAARRAATRCMSRSTRAPARPSKPIRSPSSA